MPSKGDYTMRAQPRRRKESIAKGDEPIFLRKTFDMIDTCDPELATWSKRGDTFVIKDPDQFASKVIPVFFKHSKFSSFVRQLNFYGFRKVKSAATVEEAEECAQWWEFKHDLFLRDQPHLLSEIKRATHYTAPAADSKEVDSLKGEVSCLQDRIMSMEDQISQLTAMVEGLIRNQESTGLSQPLPQPVQVQQPQVHQSSKKRRYELDAGLLTPAQAYTNFSPLAPSEQSHPVKTEYEAVEHVQFKQQVQQQQRIQQQTPIQRMPSIDFERTMSTSSDGTAFFNTELLEGLGLGTGLEEGLEFLDFEDSALDYKPVLVRAESVDVEGSNAEVDAMLMSPTSVQSEPSSFDAEREQDITAPSASQGGQVTDLARSLSALPAVAQEQLAEGLLAMLNTQSDASEVGVAVTATPSAVGGGGTVMTVGNNRRLAILSSRAKALKNGSGLESPPEIAMPLASAALGAFLTRFAHSQPIAAQAHVHEAISNAPPAAAVLPRAQTVV